MSDENVELLRDMYGRRTLAEFAESLHPDAELHQERSIPDSADYYGRDEFVRGPPSGLRKGKSSGTSPRRWSTLATEPSPGFALLAAPKPAASHSS
jgi:hypothetical protein